MPNRHPGICYRCGLEVAPNGGVFEKIGRSQREKWPTLPFGIKWLLQHHDCAAKWRGTAQHYKENPIGAPLAERES